MNIAAIFPGQGSQAVGMGKDFFEGSETAKELFNKADKVLGYELSKIILEGPDSELTLTANVQPAIVLVSYIAFNESQIDPTVAAGHSLGEYTALIASGALNFEDAISLVHKRGRYMQEAVKPGEGAMYAIMGKTYEEVDEVLNEVNDGVAEIANYNSPSQIVIAGDVKGVANAVNILSEKGAKVVELNVSAPFHCSLMKNAEISLAKDLDQTDFHQFKFPVYSNVKAQIIDSGDEARENLKKQVCGTVMWSQIITNIAKNYSETHFIEFGNGRVLSGLNKRIDRSLKSFNIGDRETARKVKADLS